MAINWVEESRESNWLGIWNEHFLDPFCWGNVSLKRRRRNWVSIPLLGELIESSIVVETSNICGWAIARATFWCAWLWLVLCVYSVYSCFSQYFLGQARTSYRHRARSMIIFSLSLSWRNLHDQIIGPRVDEEKEEEKIKSLDKRGGMMKSVCCCCTLYSVHDDEAGKKFFFFSFSLRKTRRDGPDDSFLETCEPSLLALLLLLLYSFSPMPYDFCTPIETPGICCTLSLLRLLLLSWAHTQDSLKRRRLHYFFHVYIYIVRTTREESTNVCMHGRIKSSFIACPTSRKKRYVMRGNRIHISSWLTTFFIHISILSAFLFIGLFIFFKSTWSAIFSFFFFQSI